MIKNNFNTTMNTGLFNRVPAQDVTVDTEIKPDTHYIYTYIPAPYNKKKYVDYLTEDLRNFISESREVGSDFPQIITPQVLNTDFEDPGFNEMPTHNKSRFGESINFYKDGIIVNCANKVKSAFDIAIPRRSHDFLNIEKDDPDFSVYFDLITVNGKGIYFSVQDIKTLYEIRHNFKVYVVCTEYSKTKTLCIEFKNNKHILDLIEYVHANYKDYFKTVANQVCLGFLSELPSSYVDTVYLNSLGISRAMYSVDDFLKLKDPDGSIPFTKDDLRSVTGRSVFPNKKELLLMGYNQLVMQHLMVLAGYVISFQKSEDKNKRLELMKEYNQVLYGIMKLFADEKHTIDSMCKLIVEHIFKEIDAKEFAGVRGTLLMASTRAVDKQEVHENKIVTGLYFLWMILNLTKKGTELPFVGPIDYSKMTESEAAMYWPSMNHTLLASGWMETVNGFKFMKHQDMIFKDYDNFSNYFHETSMKANRTQLEVLEGEPLEFVNKVIEEIENTGTGEYIPYNAAYEVKDDPEFKYVRFIENERFIMFFVTDYDENVMVDVYNKAVKRFGYWLLNTQPLDQEQLTSFKNNLYPKVISAIRDWKVLIERDSTMTYRGKRVPKGVNSSVERYIYLPRVKYNRDPKQVRHYYSENKILSGERRAHTRKLPVGAKPSKFQLLLAERNNVPVPPGHTFVKESLWGTGMTKKKYIYRTKSLHGMLYVDPEEQEKAIKINDLSPAAFEEQMSKFMEKRGWEIVARDNYDGGIDIRGFKEFKDGVIKKLIVQCKHWKKAIGPDVIRELIGARS